MDLNHFLNMSVFQDQIIQNGNHILKENSYLPNCQNIQTFKSQKQISNIKGRISSNYIPTLRCIDTDLDNFQKLMQNNQLWSSETLTKNPHFFQKLKNGQKPQYLWIGCSDSRVPPNEIIGLEAGELFVHRNIANQAPLSDVNVLAVIQYAVQILKVKDIIVCGHYGCGGIKAAFKKEDHGPLQAWLSHIRKIRSRYRMELKDKNQVDNESLLVELNIEANVQNISRIPIVQKRWKQGQQLRIHGLVYQLQNGILNDLEITIDSLQKLPQQFRIY